MKLIFFFFVYKLGWKR